MLFFNATSVKLTSDYISKDGAINIIKNSDLKKVGYYEKIFFIMYIKTSETACYQRDKKAILNRTKEYYEDDK